MKKTYNGNYMNYVLDRTAQLVEHACIDAIIPRSRVRNPAAACRHYFLLAHACGAHVQY